MKIHFVAALTILAGGIIHGSAQTKTAPETPQVHLQETPVHTEPRLTTTFAPIVKKAAPSVVSVYSTKMVPDVDPRAYLNDPTLRRFFGGGGDDEDQPAPRRRRGGAPARQREEETLGSGVVLSDDGYILTNNHVVEDADEIKISIANQVATFTAKIVGTDPGTDLAVLKVEGQKLPAITVADSDKLEVGDVVLAIGNPFDVGQTVTQGIVSGLGRGVHIVAYEDFIQTDAAINPGNSGGALVDAEGRLIGINTLILSESGGNQGVGFAIPINLARSIMDSIIKNGRVIRGQLGLVPQNITPGLAKEFGLKELAGALVGRVMPNSAAARAGIVAGDVVTEIDGKKVADDRHLRLIVSQTAPKTKVQVKLIREGKEKIIPVVLEEQMQAVARPKPVEQTMLRPEKDDILDGIEVTDIDRQVRRQMRGQFPNLNLPAGALIVTVEPGTPAENADLMPGDIIIEINHHAIKTADDAIKYSKDLKGDQVLLRVWRNDRSGETTFYCTVESAHKKKRAQ